MNARKRPAESRSRGHSPVEKRARQIAQSPARKTTESVSGTDTTTNKVTNGVTKVLEDRRGSLQSPNNGSRASTPVHGAPPAPSMVPKNTTSMTIASVRGIKSRKEAVLSVAKNESADSISSLSNQRKAQEKKIEDLTGTVQQLINRIVELEKKDLSERVAGLEKVNREHNTTRNDAVKASVTKEVQTKFETVQQQAADLETRLDNKINKANEIMKTQVSGFNSLAEFKKHIEQKYTEQIKILSDKVTAVDKNEVKTYEKASRNTSAIDRLEKDMEKTTDELTGHKPVIGQIKSFQSEQGKVSAEQKKLTLGQEAFSEDIKAIKTRLDVVEKKGNTVTKSPTKPSGVDIDTTAQQLKQFGVDIKKHQASVKDSQADTDAQLKLFTENIKELQVFAKNSQALLDQIAPLDERLKSLEKLPILDTVKLNEDVNALQNRVQDLQSRPSGSSVQDIPSDVVSSITAVEQKFDNVVKFIDDDILALERTVKEHGLKFDVIPNELPRLLKEQLDPFKQEVSRDYEMTSAKLETLQQTTDDRLKILQQEVITLQKRPSNTQPSSSTSTSTELKAAKEASESLKQEMIKLQQNMINETTRRASDIASLGGQMDSFRHNFRVLQNQYNNISTDELHGKMVHWILQHYPQSTANVQQQVASFQTTITSIWQSMQKLESASSPFVRVNAIDDVNKRVNSLSNEMQGFRSASETLLDRVSVLDGASSTLRQDHDTLVKDFIEPNREPLAMYGYMVELLGKQQLVIQHMIQMFPTKDGKPQITQPDWTVSPVEQPAPLILESTGTNGDGTHKDKGKGKAKP
jgi:chromosome segregation ATPase